MVSETRLTTLLEAAVPLYPFYLPTDLSSLPHPACLLLLCTALPTFQQPYHVVTDMACLPQEMGS